MTNPNEVSEEVLRPSLDEVEGLIARNEAIRERWRGNDGYIRNLNIELCALHMLRDFLVETAA